MQCGRPGFDPWRRKWQLTPVLLPGESHRWRSLVGYSPWGRKGSDTTERLHFHFILLLFQSPAAKVIIGIEQVLTNVRNVNGSLWSMDVNEPCEWLYTKIWNREILTSQTGFWSCLLAGIRSPLLWASFCPPTNGKYSRVQFSIGRANCLPDQTIRLMPHVHHLI